MSEENEKSNILKVVGLAMGLPSTILGVFALIYYLMNKNYISSGVAILIIVSIILYTFYLMIKYAAKK